MGITKEQLLSSLSTTKTYIDNKVANTFTDELKASYDQAVTDSAANKTAIETLNGTGNGSVKKTVSDEIAKVVAGADTSFDTLKEVSDWINNHSDSAATMNSAIEANATAAQNAQNAADANSTEIETLKTTVGQHTTDIASKLNANQGVVNAGKILKVGEDGNVETVTEAATHDHANKGILDKFSEKDGMVVYNGNFINSGITADGSIDLDYIDLGSGISDTPVGHIMAVMGKVAPKHYLMCDGNNYNIADYPYLSQYITTQFGAVNHFGGDGTTTFAVPDLRGEFLRGTGVNQHANQTSGLDVGEHQDATLTTSSANGTLVAGSTSTKYSAVPTNTSVLYCIKYEPTYFVDISGYRVEDELLDAAKEFTSGTSNTAITLSEDISKYDYIEVSFALYDSSYSKYTQIYDNQFKVANIAFNNTDAIAGVENSVKVLTYSVSNLVNLIGWFKDAKTLYVNTLSVTGTISKVKITSIKGISDVYKNIDSVITEDETNAIIDAIWS